MKKIKEPTFEEGLLKLEALVSALEGRTLSLDAALASFEEGLFLSRRLADQLKEAEGRVEKLTRDLAGRPVVTPLAGDGEPGLPWTAADHEGDDEGEEGV